jgi:hypothetical protein
MREEGSCVMHKAKTRKVKLTTMKVWQETMSQLAIH